VKLKTQPNEWPGDWRFSARRSSPEVRSGCSSSPGA
jgi:hypothetical protein